MSKKTKVRKAIKHDDDINERGTLRSPDPWMMDVLMDGRAASGAIVNTRTSLQVSALVAGIRCISEDLAGLTVWFYDETNGKRVKVLKHPLYRLFRNSPNPLTTAFLWKQSLIFTSILYGDGYSRIVRNAGGEVDSMYWLDPTTVKPWIPSPGVLKYKITPPSGSNVDPEILDSSEIFHLPSLSFDSICGMGIVYLARESIGAAIALQEFSSAFFRNGLTPSGILMHPDVIDGTARQNMQESMRREKQGFKKAHDLMILEEGVKYQQISSSPADSQLTEQWTFLVQDIARWLRVPSWMINENSKSTFNNIEAQGISYVNQTLRPWGIRIESEIKMKLFNSEEEDLYAEHDYTPLLKGTANDMADAVSKRINCGVTDINEGRNEFGMEPIGKNGDEHFIPVNVVPIDRAINPPAPPPPPKPIEAPIAPPNDAIKGKPNG